MLTNILLGVAYYFGGMVIALLGSCALGFALCVLVGLFNIFRYKRTWALIVGYAVGSLFCLMLIQGVLLIAGTIGDHTGYKMQTMLLVGLVFPGVLALSGIKPFVNIALKQTRGIKVE